MNKIETFLEYIKSYDIDLKPMQGEQILTYMDELLMINQKINLTAIKDETEFTDKHLVDSLVCDLSNLKPGNKVLDVGTGGGFPGVPLAIKYPNLQFVLMDSTAKKLKTVEMLVEKCGIRNISFLVGRAEELAHKTAYREQFDVVVSRGVANLAILCELCIPFVKKGGVFYAWKGRNAETELEEAKNALLALKSKIINSKIVNLVKSGEKHVIMSIQKKEKTLNQYPRNYGTIKKRPL